MPVVGHRHALVCLGARERLAAEQIELRRTRILEGEGGVTHMHYRVKR